MLSWTDVERVAARIPALTLTPGQPRAWHANGKTAAWERQLSKKDMIALGENAPKGAVLAIHTVDLPTKLAWIQTEPESCFDSPHFANYPTVLVNLHTADEQVVYELLADAAEIII